MTFKILNDFTLNHENLPFTSADILTCLAVARELCKYNYIALHYLRRLLFYLFLCQVFPKRAFKIRARVLFLHNHIMMVNTFIR